jgi:hypothetical protein
MIVALREGQDWPQRSTVRHTYPDPGYLDVLEPHMMVHDSNVGQVPTLVKEYNMIESH